MEEFVAKCQHCGNETVQFVLHHEVKEEFGYDNAGNPHSYIDFLCFAVCKTCNNYSFFSIVDGNEGNEFSLYPLEKSIHVSIPKIVSKAYTEALKVKKVSPTAFLLLIRKTLEVICKHQNAKGKSLKEKIEYLHKEKGMPELILSVANSTRSLGNLSAHASDFEWTNEDAELIDDLCQILIEYVYIIPDKLEKLSKRMEDKMK